MVSLFNYYGMNGVLFLDGSSVASTSISYWEGIRRAASEYNEKREELRQLEEIIKGGLSINSLRLNQMNFFLEQSDAELVKMAKCDLESTTDSFDEAIDELARRVSIHIMILLI